MKSKALFCASLVLALSSVFTAAETDQSPKKSEKPRIEVCFVLDTTGSMTGLIEGAKQKIWSIANEMIGAKPTPEIKVGLVAFRDRGDDYVTKVFDLSDDIDAVYGHLQTLRAAGGGDTPESVNEALDDAVRKISWSSSRKVLKIIFLVGDAPPHMDYADGPKYPDICKEAVKRDLIINTIQCGSMAETATFWHKIADASEGSFAAIPQSGNMVAIATPMDDELTTLNRKIGGTLVAYGSESTRNMVAAKQLAAESAPAPVAADRLSFNTRSGRAVQGGGELLDSLNQGTVKLESVKKSDLPSELQKLDDKELKTEIDKRQTERSELQARIQKISQEREDYIANQRKQQKDGKGDSFDAQVAANIRTQAARKGIDYSH